MYDSLLRGKITLNIEGRDHTLVEAGLGHYRDTPVDRVKMLEFSMLPGNNRARKKLTNNVIENMPTTCCVSEPLVVLAATSFLDRTSPFDTLWQHVTRSIDKLKGSENNGFETYISFLMADVFAEPAPLNKIFEFPHSQVPKWAEQKARLVSLSRDPRSNGLSVQEFNWPGAAVSSSHFGVELGPLDTIEWLNHRHRYSSPFVFPDNNMGPDVLFVLQLEDGTFIWVALQAKYHKNPIYGKNLAKAVRTMAPDKYWVFAPSSLDLPRF